MSSNIKNLKDYILHLDNWIPKNICETSIEELKKDDDWQRHFYTNKRFEKYSKNGEKELDISNGDNLSYLEELHKLTWKALEKYIVIDKKGEEYFNGWKGFTQLRFNRYDKEQIMSKHCDHIHSMFEEKKRNTNIKYCRCFK